MAQGRAAVPKGTSPGCSHRMPSFAARPGAAAGAAEVAGVVAAEAGDGGVAEA